MAVAGSPEELPETARTARTIPRVLAEQAAANSASPAVTWAQADQTTSTLTWNEYRERVLDAATAYLGLGLEPGGTVAVLAANRVEHLVADLAAAHCGAASVSLYATFSLEQLAHVLADAEPHIIVVEDTARTRVEQVPWVREHRPHLIALPDQQDCEATIPAARPQQWSELLGWGAQHRATFAREIEHRITALGPDDPATYIYTSGTTGLSKGVTLTHHNLLWDAQALHRTGCFDFDYRVVSSLPLAHVAERLWSIYMPLHTGGHVWCCPDPYRLLDALHRHRPSFFMAVPRVWEKLQQGAELLLASPTLEDRRADLQRDRNTLLEEWRLLQNDAHVPAPLAAAAQIAREGVLRDVQALLGLDRTLSAGCGAAPLRADVTEFFASLGVYIQQAYGLTETAGVSVAARDARHSRGSVGFPLPGTRMRIAPDGEIELNSPGNTPGYRNLKDATAELYTADGWLRTGDIGRIDEAGRLHITDRKKEILVNASGKNIAPTAIESLIGGRLFIDQVIVVGEGQPYVVALMTVDPQALQAFARTQGITRTTVEELVDHPAVHTQAQALVDQANDLLSRPEQIKRFALLPSLWSAESGELTPTLKKRRKVIVDRHRDAIDALYERS
ncbi:AMP-dependent synthetase/ligase [Streptomyces sp. NPDC003442]